MNGKNQILEICQVSGRRRIKIVLHEIYANNSEYNENGITWLEQYTRDNADTIKGMHFKHIGEEIPEDVPAIEYYDYILKNFRNPKPKEEWTDVDYKADYSRWQRLHVASVLRQQLMKQTIPLIDRQKRIIERVRNGTDFDVFSSQKFLEMLS